MILRFQAAGSQKGDGDKAVKKMSNGHASDSAALRRTIASGLNNELFDRTKYVVAPGLQANVQSVPRLYRHLPLVLHGDRAAASVDT